MKAELNEYNGCFEIALTPETIEDAAKIIRMAINGTKEVRSVNAYAYSSNAISGAVVIGKRKQSTSTINRA